MELQALIKNIKITKLINYKNINITGLNHNSKNVAKGDLFFCINGLTNKGETFVVEAINNGAIAVVTESELNIDCIQIVVDNVRVAMALIAKCFYDSCCDNLKIIMVTGTNGKTTSTYVLNSIFNVSGIKCAIIGTNGIYYDNKQLYYGLTTPDPIDLHYYFKQLYNLGVKVVIMEASAHAIALNKLCGINAEAMLYTNLTYEHVDFFENMQNYVNTKINYINNGGFKFIVANGDCEYAKLINSKLPLVFYGLQNPAQTFAVNINYSILGTDFFVNCFDEVFEVKSCLIGLYNVYNLLGCITIAYLFGLSNEQICLGIKNLKHIPGRFNLYNLDLNNKVIIDFAHTPDGFYSVLNEIKKLRQGKIITIFGCVGYSDVIKRNQMGKIANKYSNELIITTDNINFQDFNKVALDITKFVTVPFSLIPDRKQAIMQGVNKLTQNDTLVILGKGAETYNLINGEKVKHNDFEALKQAVATNYNFFIKENA